ncbi:MAG: methyltransferase domain-containing protein, partial [Planctomycetota bacterium]
DFVAADFERPAESGLGPADLVMSVDVIEHMLDPDLLLDFIRGHTHADSWVVVSTPERDVRRGPDNMKSKKAEHVREWNQSEFAAYLDDRGFEVVEHRCAAAFRVGWSRLMWKERWRLLRKGISLDYSQVAVCRVRS